MNNPRIYTDFEVTRVKTFKSAEAIGEANMLKAEAIAEANMLKADENL